MRIAVIDDERPSRSELCHLISEYLPDIQIDEGNSGQSALALAASGVQYDAFFLDIHLGDMEGTALSPVLKKLLPNVKIVFATAYDAYAVKAFDMEAVDYIMKPFEPSRIRRALDKLMEGQELSSRGEESQQLVTGKISIACEKRMLLLDIADIAYIEAADGQCVLSTKKGRFTSAQTLNAFEKKLSPAQFFRTHKSYLINLQYVEEIYPWFNGLFCVKLQGYERENLPVSRKQIKLLRELFE